MEKKKKKMLEHAEYQTSGSESSIFLVKDGIYKRFSHGVYYPKRLRKIAKLEYLEQFEHLKKYYPNIYYVVLSIFNKEVIDGYVMEDIIGPILSEGHFSLEEKELFITVLETILEEFNKEGIYYHDLRKPNIALHHNNIILLDIDSITTPEYPEIDAIPTDLAHYLKHGGKPGLNAQTVMFNKLTISFLSDHAHWREYIEFDKEGEEIFSQLNTPEPDTAIDNEYLFRHIKRLK